MSDYGACDGYAFQPDFEKDPDETLDFPFNWKPELYGDTIFTSEFLLPDGLTLVSESNTTDTATPFVSGGEAGRVYRITNRIVTIGGRIRDRTIHVLIVER
jgi:hypothetical protein